MRSTLLAHAGGPTGHVPCPPERGLQHRLCPCPQRQKAQPQQPGKRRVPSDAAQRCCGGAQRRALLRPKPAGRERQGLSAGPRSAGRHPVHRRTADPAEPSLCAAVLPAGDGSRRQVTAERPRRAMVTAYRRARARAGRLPCHEQWGSVSNWLLGCSGWRSPGRRLVQRPSKAGVAVC